MLVLRLKEYSRTDPSHIAAILGIDDYVAQIIFSETKNNQ
jgi:hypothetical protein